MTLKEFGQAVVVSANCVKWWENGRLCRIESRVSSGITIFPGVFIFVPPPIYIY